MATSISGVGSISSAGIGSGLDVTSLVGRLMEVERLPLIALQTQASTYNSKLSTLGRLQSNYGALRDKANALVSTTLWSGTTASASDDSAIKVSTASTAAAGNYSIGVQKLAIGQSVTGTALASANTRVGTGTLTIELGHYGSGVPAADFTANPEAATLAVAVGETDATLAGLRDKINSANASVVASIVTDSSGARLSLRSRSTGAENAFRISAIETVDDGDTATGLSALAFDATQASSPMQRTAVAGNAELTVNGLAITSASNTLNNVVDGLTMTLQKTTTDPVQVNVKADNAAVKTAITDFVAAFNTLAGYIHAQTAFNSDNNTGGSLQGDQSTLGMQSQLRAVLNNSSTASSVWGRLSDIGIGLKADGTLDISATKLDNALENPTELRKLISADGSGDGNSGIVRRFKRLADDTLGANGALDARTTGLRSSVSRNSKSQEKAQKRLDQTESRLRRQYTSLDTTMARLTATSTYVRQQFSPGNSN